MSAIDNEMIENFMAITGVKETSRARFYLEAANADLNIAVNRFLEDDANAPVAGEVVPPPQLMSNTVSSIADGFGNNDNDDDDDDEDDEDYRPFGARHAHAASKPAEPKKSGASSRDGPRIFGLNNFSEQNEEEEDEEKGQAFYAGGSETSGQQILGPSRKNPDKLIKNLFQKAKEHGAEEVAGSDGATTSKGPVVYGTGYRLGTGNEPSEVIQGATKPKQPKVHVLKMWKNGFNVDDGALRTYEDPQNKEFLQAIARGEPPRELIKQAEGAEVSLDMEDHRDEEFVPPKPKYVLYNDGYKLGSPTPNVVSNASPDDKAVNEEKAKRLLGTDESKPTTQIQIRLSDGSRLIIKANQTHTVGNIRQFVNTARPEYQTVNYSLLMTYPNKELTNNEDTLQSAGLLNAVIVQKLK